MEKILVTGAKGQIGSDLVVELRKLYGDDAVLETDLAPAKPGQSHYEPLDVLNRERLHELVETYKITSIYHLASLLSARGEQKPDLTWNINIDGLRNVLDVAKDRQSRLFWPSSIAAFGPTTPRHNTPQQTVLEPTTMYGVTKVAGELLCQYYAVKYDLDVRSVRFPGIISYSAPPGGGTTDFAVEIFYEALKRNCYNCFVRPDTRLPMMYMPDAIKSIVDIMKAPKESVKIRTSYNLAAISFSAEELAEEIKKHLPGFECTYAPDFRQKIADSWPAVIDDSRAREDWNWQHQYDLSAMVKDMLEKLA